MRYQRSMLWAAPEQAGDTRGGEQARKFSRADRAAAGRREASDAPRTRPPRELAAVSRAAPFATRDGALRARETAASAKRRAPTRAMYHAPPSARESDKKRPRKQPPNQVWVDAIMSKTRSNEPSPSNAGAPPPLKQMRLADEWSAMPRVPPPPPPPPAGDVSAVNVRSSRSPSPAIAALVSVSESAFTAAATNANPFQEQLGLGDDALAAIVAKSLKELVADTDCSFIARGVCHLCSDKEKKLVPVVNFCPDFSPTHSLCREHLRSMHRVRLVDIFAGKNQPTVSKRALRCTVCSLSCPCSKCQLQREAEIARYKQWLAGHLEDPRGVPTRHEIVPAEEPPMPRSRSRQNTPTPPPVPSEARDGHRRRLEDHAEEKSRRSERTVYYSEEKPLPSMGDGTYSYEASPPPVDMRADEKGPARPGRFPKRAAKESVPFPLDSTNVGYASREHTPRGVGGMEDPTDLASPSAASVLNCPDSEKSLVDLLSSLNQRVTPAVRYFAEPDEPRFREMMDNSQVGYERDPFEARPFSNGYQPANMVTEDYDDAENNPRRQKRKRDHDIPGKPKDSSSASYDFEEGEAAARGDATSYGNRPIEKEGDEGVSTYRQNAPSQLSAADRRHKQASPIPEAPPSPSPRGRRARVPVPPPESKVHSRKREPPAMVPPPSANARKRRSDAASVPVLPTSERKSSRGPSHHKHESQNQSAQKRTRGSRSSSASDEEMKHSEDEEIVEDRDGDDESELDTNLDYCEVCLAAGDLVCCDVCPRSFHLKCLKMTEEDLPEGDWQCAECKKPSYFESFGAAVAEKNSVQSKCLQIIQCLKSHPFSKPFLHPVENVPHYANIVKQPMDLSTIEKKLLDNKYMVSGRGTLQGSNGTSKILHLGSFAEDVRLVWANCKLFNDDGSGITRAADHLSDGFEKLYQHVLDFVERSNNKARREDKKVSTSAEPMSESRSSAPPVEEKEPEPVVSNPKPTAANESTRSEPAQSNTTDSPQKAPEESCTRPADPATPSPATNAPLASVAASETTTRSPQAEEGQSSEKTGSSEKDSAAQRVSSPAPSTTAISSPSPTESATTTFTEPAPSVSAESSTPAKETSPTKPSPSLSTDSDGQSKPTSDPAPPTEVAELAPHEESVV